MALPEKDFDRMVRMNPDLYQQASVVARIEGMNLKAFIEHITREAIAERQTKITATFIKLQSNATLETAAS